MAIIKTVDLIDISLDWAVAKAGGGAKVPANFRIGHADYGMFQYSTDWAHGGPIIEREGIELICNLTAIEAERFSGASADWHAFYRQRRASDQRSHGTTPLVAAMRAYVACKLGDKVDVPEL